VAAEPGATEPDIFDLADACVEPESTAEAGSGEDPCPSMPICWAQRPAEDEEEVVHLTGSMREHPALRFRAGRRPASTSDCQSLRISNVDIGGWSRKRRAVQLRHQGVDFATASDEPWRQAARGVAAPGAGDRPRKSDSTSTWGAGGVGAGQRHRRFGRPHQLRCRRTNRRPARAPRPPGRPTPCPAAQGDQGSVIDPRAGASFTTRCCLRRVDARGDGLECVWRERATSRPRHRGRWAAT
jgi:hypothetical protein